MPMSDPRARASLSYTSNARLRCPASSTELMPLGASSVGETHASAAGGKPANGKSAGASEPPSTRKLSAEGGGGRGSHRTGKTGGSNGKGHHSKAAGVAGKAGAPKRKFATRGS